MVTNHWGYTVDSEVPTTGVFSNYDFTSWFWEEVSMNGIDPDWEEYCKDAPKDEDGEPIEYGYEQSVAYMGMMLGADGKYDCDPTADWSGIVTLNGSMTITQVIRSKWGMRAALGSPCIPGQCDADSEGEYLCYAPDPELLEDEALRSRVFLLP